MKRSQRQHTHPRKRVRTKGSPVSPISTVSSIARTLFTPENVGKVARRLFRTPSKTASKSRYRGLGSRTKTEVVEKRESSLQEISQHNDLSIRNMGVRRVGKYYAPPKGLGTFSYRNQNNWIMTTVQGKQIVDLPEVIMTREMIIATTSNNRFERYKLPDDLFTLNPYVAVPNSSLYPGPHSAVANNDVIYFNYCTSTLQFLSMTTVPQKVTVLYCTPKFDTNTSPIEAWQDIVNSQALTQSVPTTAATPATVTASPGAGETTNIGASPMEHREWKKAWNVVASFTIILQPGDQHARRLCFKFNQFLNRQTFNTVRNGGNFLKGITVFPMVITYAGLQGIGTGETATEVAHAAPKVGVVHHQHYMFKAVPVSRLSTSRIYKGLIESTALTGKQIDDLDNVVNVETM